MLWRAPTEAVVQGKTIAGHLHFWTQPGILSTSLRKRDIWQIRYAALLASPYTVLSIC